MNIYNEQTKIKYISRQMIDKHEKIKNKTFKFVLKKHEGIK